MTEPTEPTEVDVLSGRQLDAFPTLSKAQVDRVRRFATERTIQKGETLFSVGDSGVPFFVILEGEIEIVHPKGALRQLVTVHHAGSFSGEISLLADRRSLVEGRALTRSRLLVVEPVRFRTLVQTESQLSEILMRAFILRRVGLIGQHYGDVVLVGSQHSAETLRLQEFLTRNSHPYQYLDVDVDSSVQALLDGFHVAITDIPLLVCRNEKFLKNPSNVEVAECLGFNTSFDPAEMHDLIVVGAGPAGLAAAVYGASEGLDVLVLEGNAPGGQAGSSSKIENYLGFPTGISGQALAGRALTQAEKFGARIAIAKTAVRLDCDSVPYCIHLDGGETLQTKAIVIATGAQYRKLDIPGLQRFEGVGIYYGATFVEAQRCNTDEVIIVGGGNSAGQAAMYLSQTSLRVHVLIRGPSLDASMSRYLIRRIEMSSNITLHPHTELVELSGDEHLERVVWVNRQTGERSEHHVRHIFSMAGAVPNTDWLKGCVQMDDKGFVLTGTDIRQVDHHDEPAPSPSRLPANRPPYLLETSLRGVFAVGDVRSTSVKRVASAVGEGSVCIQLVHKVLAE